MDVSVSVSHSGEHTGILGLLLGRVRACEERIAELFSIVLFCAQLAATIPYSATILSHRLLVFQATNVSPYASATVRCSVRETP